jgi:UPF0716 protein FxsA
VRLGFFGIIAVALPALEMVGIYQIGSRIGLAWTLVWLIGSALAGIAVIRTAHEEFVPRLSQAVALGQAPFSALWVSGRRFLAGVLLILPGIISDVLALILLLWPVPDLPPADAAAQGARGPQAGMGRPGPGNEREGDVIEGEYKELD